MDRTMKTRTTLLFSLTCALAASASACTGETKPVVEESVASTAQDIVVGTGSVMIWPAGPIAWGGFVGTWPINVWAPFGLGTVAFDVMGATGLGIGLAGFPGVTPLAIT